MERGKKQLWLFLALGALLLAADQGLKAWIVAHLPMGEHRAFLPGVVELMQVHNYGAAWSSFSGMRWLLVAVTGAILAAVTYVLARGIVRHPLGVLSGALILSGGLGNILDRLRLGYVVDLFHFEFWPSYPVFNLADICIVSGAILGMVYYLWFYEKYDRKEGKRGTADTDGKG